METGLLALALLSPFFSALLCIAIRRPRFCEIANLIAATVVFVSSICLVLLSRNGPYFHFGKYLILDMPGAWVLLCSAIVYMLASVYSIGYMRVSGHDDRLWAYYALFAGFALTIFATSVMNNAGLYWIAIELTTLVSTFLVGFERAAESMEAAWKYIIIVSAGISLALLGTVLFYWAGSFVFGPTYDMTWAALREGAPRMNGELVILSFLLIAVGYGTKVGLAPMHTWLPDAHSEAPAPISAMLSGALLNGAMLGIVRYLQVADAAGVGWMAREVLAGFGVFSLLVGALFIVRQTGIKRLMAYSSIEHMGIVALGIAFGGVVGTVGAFYHMLNHSLNKSLMFFGAGNAMRTYGTKRISRIRAVGQVTPISGALWLAGAAAITGAPPFGLFLSEFAILRSGLQKSFAWATGAMLVLLIVIFVGFLNHFRTMYFNDAPPHREGFGEIKSVSAWCIAPMWMAVIPLLAFGVWWPKGIWDHLVAVALSLGASP